MLVPKISPIQPMSLDHVTGVFLIMDHTGHDDSYKWDKDNPESLEIAEAVFKLYVSKGYYAHVPGIDDVPGEILQTFNPEVTEILFSPPMAGG